MLLVFANHPYHTAAMDDLALVTNLLDRRTYLHFEQPPFHSTTSRMLATAIGAMTPPGGNPEEPESYLYL
jgi:hypothetical protein